MVENIEVARLQPAFSDVCRGVDTLGVVHNLDTKVVTADRCFLLFPRPNITVHDRRCCPRPDTNIFFLVKSGNPASTSGREMRCVLGLGAVCLRYIYYVCTPIMVKSKRQHRVQFKHLMKEGESPETTKRGVYCTGLAPFAIYFLLILDLLHILAIF